MPSPLVDLFLEAIRVDALSLHEAPMALFARRALRDLNIRIIEDDAGRKVGGDCGNLICVPPTWTAERPAIALLAHMDTPRSTTGVRPVITNGRIASDGTTILGVDNRAGFSTLLHVLAGHAREETPGNFIVVFTIGEEIGMYGSKNLDLLPYNVPMAFVFDCSRRPGTFIRSAVGSSLYKATVKGKAAHAGVSPEKGINAIHLAAQALSKLPTGRLSPTMTCNMATISGGTATNVVPEHCIIEGEVRAFAPGPIDDHLAVIDRTFRSVVEPQGGTVTLDTSVDFPPFSLDPSCAVFRRTVDVLSALGLRPNPIDYLGGSDANMLNANGTPAVNLGIGAQNPHANDEFILVEDLEMSATIARALIATTR
jgi:tripeptide aminopeptidase